MTQNLTARRRAAVAGLMGAGMLLTACAADGPTDPSGDDPGVLESHGLDGLTGRELVEELDAAPVEERPTDLIASVEPDAVVVTDEQGQEESVPLPEDEFYVSVAPYIDQTHDCFYHSLTTCLGELQNQDVEVTVTEEGTGEVLVDETLETYDNGFFGLWLPRGIDAEMTIEHEGLSSTTSLSTGEDDPTCLTTSQLS